MSKTALLEYLVWRAAGRLAIGAGAAKPAVDAGLAEFGARVRFRHPLVRSAAYRSASIQTRQELHGALAETTDPAVDPDRRAWHRAEAAPGPDEEVAAELEPWSARAQRVVARRRRPRSSSGRPRAVRAHLDAVTEREAPALCTWRDGWINLCAEGWLPERPG